MKPRLSPQEIIAWIFLTFSAVLLSATVALAQGSGKEEKVRIKLSTTENGKTSRIDTVFSASDAKEIERFLEENKIGRGDEFDLDFSVSEKAPGESFRIRMKGHEGAEKELEALQMEIEAAMDESEEEMKQACSRLKKLKFDISADEGADKGEFVFDMDFFPPPPVAPMAPSFRPEDLPAGEQLDEDQLVIRGRKGEAPPVFEKTVTSDQGDPLFIFRRSGGQEKNAVKESVRDLKVYPNPASEYLKISFKADETVEIFVELYGPDGKKLYAERRSKFKGEYERSIDLSGESPGTYLVEIRAGEFREVRKVIVK